MASRTEAIELDSGRSLTAADERRGRVLEPLMVCFPFPAASWHIGVARGTRFGGTATGLVFVVPESTAPGRRRPSVSCDGNNASSARSEAWLLVAGWLAVCSDEVELNDKTLGTMMFWTSDHDTAQDDVSRA